MDDEMDPFFWVDLDMATSAIQRAMDLYERSKGDAALPAVDRELLDACDAVIRARLVVEARLSCPSLAR